MNWKKRRKIMKKFYKVECVVVEEPSEGEPNEEVIESSEEAD